MRSVKYEQCKNNQWLESREKDTYKNRVSSLVDTIWTVESMERVEQ